MSQQRHTDSSDLETRDALAAETTAAVQRFYEAFNQHDLDAMMAAVTDDCVFEGPYPYPDGTRYQGQKAVRAHYEQVFRSRPKTAVLDTEEMFAVGERCTVLWVLRWIGNNGEPQHYRGVDVHRVRDGSVAEKLSYNKRDRSG